MRDWDLVREARRSRSVVVWRRRVSRVEAWRRVFAREVRRVVVSVAFVGSVAEGVGVGLLEEGLWGGCWVGCCHCCWAFSASRAAILALRWEPGWGEVEISKWSSWLTGDKWQELVVVRMSNSMITR